MSATRLPPLPTSARAARDFTRYTVAPERGYELAETAALVVSELVTNALLHAGTDITLRIQSEPGSDAAVRIEVTDSGHGNPLPRQTGPALAEHGRGLDIVAAVSRRWGVEMGSAGKTVWCEIDGSAPHPPPVWPAAAFEGVDDALDRSSRRARGEL